MTEFIQPTTTELYFRDPDIEPPPKAASLLLLNPSGVLIIGSWTNDCLGWCPKPKIPKSIKDKMTKHVHDVNISPEHVQKTGENEHD